MASNVSSRVNDNKGILTLSGRFDFSIHRDFRSNYESILSTAGVNEIDVDLNGVDYIDSSALGMLLLLREKATGKNIQMTLLNPKDSVRQVLEVANFGRLFSIT
jgi:HptB-dependent secretion and biofilm anti anti-sigma factor